MTEQMNVPKLRFGEFDGIWLSDRVGNIFDIKAGGDIDKENVSDVRNEKFPYPVFANAEKKKGLYGYSDLYKVDPPCLTVAGRGVNIGIAHARFERFYPIVRLLTLKPKKEQDVKFHEYVFNRLNIFVESTGVPQLTGPQISSYRVALPAHPEQQKIASFLSKVDEKIALLTEKKDKLTEYKKGVIQQLFNGKWENQNGQLAFIPPTLRFKADDGSEFPDWEEKKLIEVVSKQRYSFTGGPFGSDLKSDDYTETGVRIVQLQNIGDGCFNNDYKIYTSEAKADALKSCNIYPGDLLLSKMGDPVARALLVPETEKRYVMCSDGIRVVPDANKYNSYFLMNYINSPYFRNRAFAVSTGSTRQRIGLTELKQLTVIAPSVVEQTKIANFLSAIDKKIDLTNSELEKATKWKEGLLQQMFV